MDFHRERPLAEKGKLRSDRKKNGQLDRIIWSKSEPQKYEVVQSPRNPDVRVRSDRKNYDWYLLQQLR